MEWTTARAVHLCRAGVRRRSRRAEREVALAMSASSEARTVVQVVIHVPPDKARLPGDRLAVYKLKMNSPLKKIFDAFCNKRNDLFDRSEVVFWRGYVGNGQPLRDDQTPLDVGLEEGTEFDAENDRPQGRTIVALIRASRSGKAVSTSWRR